MRVIEMDRYRLLMKHIKDYSLALNHHEREYSLENPEKRPLSLHDVVQTCFPITQCWEYKADGFIVCFNSKFSQTLCLYETCFKNNPSSFQKGDAINVLNTLYKQSNYWSSFEDYIDYLLTEACCYIVIINGDSFKELLRVDLFRKLDLDKKSEKQEFTGGLFHCLKHFSMDGINLCNGSDKNDTFDLFHIIYLIGKAFLISIKSHSEEGILKIDSSHFYKAIFYCEECSSVYFIKTIRKGK